MSNSEPPEFQSRMREMVEVMKRHGFTGEEVLQGPEPPQLQPLPWQGRPMRSARRGPGFTRPSQRKPKRRAKGKAQRRARKVNRR